MKAVDTNLLEFLKKAEQFIVPIYQRVYSWETPECERLWDDIVRAGDQENVGAHFTGSVVYVERDQSNIAAAEPHLIIDGQQRVTTVTLLMAALAARLGELPEGEREPIEGFAPGKIRAHYLTNHLEEGDRYFKLILSKSDRAALKAVINEAPIPESDSRVPANFDFFVRKLNDPQVNLSAVCLGLRKLEIVDVKLTRGKDNPQLVFESMNSTGKALSQADLIRNFVLMDLPPKEQTHLYEHYWFAMEQQFKGGDERRFDEFVRHYLTLKTGTIPREGDIYDAFKAFTGERAVDGITVDEIVVELSAYATRFARMALGSEPSASLASRFAQIEQLRATPVYPFLLRVYTDYDDGVISEDEFRTILESTIAYVLRRAICGIATNSYRDTFAKFADAISVEDYVESINAKYLTLPANKRFPNDVEFSASLETVDLYNLKISKYFLSRLENYGRKEAVNTADYTIEHILPQNEDLSAEWQVELGSDWKDVQSRLLHTLGNLTLTGYNPEYSDKPFLEKRDMEGGFKNSPLRLNEGLGSLDAWNEQAISDRAGRLAKLAVSVWPTPAARDEVVAEAQRNSAEPGGFDWTLLHKILERVPPGKWTGYFYLAEAVGTSAQAVASHVSRCPECVGAYRVLTWDGHLSEGFAWIDSADTRDPVAVLESEGITFENGYADPSAKLAAEELLALVEDPE